MRIAFVVQVQKTSSGNQLAGSVEEVDTGKQATFQAEAELIGFLRECVAKALQDHQQAKGGK